ncbi:MAG TPA: VanZ family protein [Phycisphaerae bacterium]|nr:VanZ family protein [Phycisphaerae bacterium]
MVPGRPIHWRRNLLILYWFWMFVLTHWPDIDEYTPDEIRLIPHLDKITHCVMYLGWILLWGQLLSGGGRRLGPALLSRLGIGGVAWAAFDELTQAFVARQPSLADFFCDLGGILIGLGVLLACQRRRERSAGAASAVLPEAR